MIEKIKNISNEINNYKIDSKESFEVFRLKYLSKNGILNGLFSEFKLNKNLDKKIIGKELNILKNKIESILNNYKDNFNNIETKPDIDLTLPSIPNTLGSRHPLNIVKSEVINIFKNLGFNTQEGPEIENDFYNFTGLNFSENHPAREMQDTFFIDNDNLLRTHTSAIQCRIIEKNKFPIRTLTYGRVYRNEHISARSHCQFHQIDGLYIDKDVSMKDLKNILYYFVKKMFGDDINIRFRASYFPFTEPSVEVDINCLICKGSGCNICKHSGFVEIGGAGMIHNKILKLNGIDNIYTGYAFGMGIERITMLKYNIKDIRLFTENDIRFLKQFKSL